MALRDITRNAVVKAIQEFDRLELEKMCERYDGTPSRKWYVQYGKKRYDQKLLLRAAHQLNELGPLPPGSQIIQGSASASTFAASRFCGS